MAPDSDQAETDHQQIHRHYKVRNLDEKRTLIVHVNALVIGTAQWNIAAPLIGDDPVVHEATRDTQDFTVEEEFRSEAWRLERHREEMAARATIRRLSVTLEIFNETWPERLTACIDHG